MENDKEYTVSFHSPIAGEQKLSVARERRVELDNEND
jgi:hypothetical protein